MFFIYKYIKIIFFYFLKFIFNIDISKLSTNTKKKKSRKKHGFYSKNKQFKFIIFLSNKGYTETRLRNR